MKSKNYRFKKLAGSMIALIILLAGTNSLSAQTGDASITNLSFGSSCINVQDSVRGIFHTDSLLTAVNISIELNGVVLGTVPLGAVPANFTFPLAQEFVFAKPGKNIFRVWVSGTSYTDVDHSNDTATLIMNIQLQGTFTVGSQPTNDFASLKEAVDTINAYGICGPTIINFDAGHSETNCNIVLNTNTTSPVNTLVFNGNNAVITAGTGTGTADGIFKIAGTDYVTFDNFILLENAANTTNTDQMEWGIAMLRWSATNGTQNCTISNCNITLNRTNTSTIGINSASRDVNGLPITVSGAAGTNSNLSIHSNTIQNCYSAISFAGFNSASPYALYDQNNKIGSEGGNIIGDFGGGSVSARAVYSIYQNNLKIENNTIQGGTGTTGATAYGIFCSTSNEANIDIINNDITVSSSSATQTLYGIAFGNGSSGTTNRINVVRNSVHNCTYPTATTGGFYGIQNQVNNVAGTVRIDSNAVHTCTLAGSGIMTGIDGGGASTVLIFDNQVKDLFRFATTGTNAMSGIRTGGTASSMIYVSRNKVYNLTSSSAEAVSVNGVLTAAGTSYLYNNFISELKAPSASASATPFNHVNGINVSGGAAANLYFNSIYLDAASTGTNFGSSGIFASTTPTLDMKNNIVVNVSNPSGSGKTVAYRRSGANLMSFTASSDKNLYYAGTPDTNKLIFHDGTNGQQTLSDYRSFVTPSDQSCYTELPPFSDVSASPYNLHLLTTVPTQCESGGIPVTMPPVLYDIDVELRNANFPDVGADEGNFIPNDFTAPSISFTPLSDALNNSARTLIATITDPSGVYQTGSGRPVLYWKVNNGSYNAVTGTYTGSNQYTFIFGAGISPFDSVMYYIAAQDSLATPNVGVNPASGASGFSSNPPAVSTPPSAPAKYYYAVINTFPYTESFESSVPPLFWKQTIDVTGSTPPQWSMVSTGTYPTCTPSVGTNMAKFNSYNASAGTRARLTSLALDLSSLVHPQLTFFMYHSTTTYYDSLTIEISADRTNWTRLSGPYTQYAPAAGWVQETINLSSYAGQTVYIAFHGTSRYGYNIFLDFITIEEGPSCLPPTNLVAYGPTGTSADLAWTAGGSETNWQIEYGPSGFTQGTGTYVASGNDTMLLSGLSVAQSYSYFVRAVCGVGDTSSWAGPVDFSTSCGIVSIPFTQDFGGMVFPPICWLNLKTAGTSAGIWSSVTAGTNPTCSPHSTPSMARFNSYSYQTGTKGKLVTPPVQIDNDSYWIKFWMYRDNSYATTADLVNVYYDSDTSLTGALLLGTVNRSISLSPVVASSGWYEYTFLLPDTIVNQTGYFSFEAVSGYGNNMFIDDITVETAPDCIPPSGIYADNLSGYEAILHWNSSGPAANIKYREAGSSTYNYIYHETQPYSLTGLSPLTTYYVWVQDSCGAGNLSVWSDSVSFTTTVSCPVPASLNAINITSSSADLRWSTLGSHTGWEIEWGLQGFSQGTGTYQLSANDTFLLNGLTSATSYSFYVRAFCVTGDTSTWAGPYIFTTACVAYNVPIVEGFEGISGAGSLPTCWAKTSRWNTYTAPSTYNRGPRSGNNYAACQWNANDYLFTQGINLTAGTSYDISLWYITDGNGGWDTLAIKYGTSQIATAMTSVLTYVTGPNNTTYAKLSARLVAPSTGVYYFGIFCKATSAPWYLTLDDISIIETPPCSPPSNLNAINLTNADADLTWTPAGASTEWQVEWGLNGFTQGAGTIIQAGNDTIHLSSLSTATSYEYYVRTICGPGDTSAWEGPYGFRTSLIPITVPVSMNFEQGTGTWVIENGSETNQWYLGTATAYNSDTSLYVSNDNGVSNAYSISSSSVVYFYNDIEFTAGAPAFNLSFNWRCLGEGTSPNAYDFLQVFLVDPATVTPLSGTELATGAISIQYNQEVTWQSENIELSGSIAGTTQRLVFMWSNDGSLGDNPPAAIDNIELTVLTCPNPSNLTAFNITTSTADLAWTSPASLWQIEYGLAGFTPGTGTIVASANDTFNLTGLTGAQTYSYYVRSICNPGDTSAWEGPYTFNMVCVPVSAPYYQNFDFVTTPDLPNCWSKKVAASSVYADVYTDDFSANSQPNSMNLYNSSSTGSGNYIILITPEWNDLDNAKQIRFFAYGDDDLIIGTMTDPADETTFAPYDTITPTSSYAEYTIPFDRYTGSNHYIAFRHAATSTYNDIYLDDFIYEVIPSCQPVSNLSATNVTASTADLSWTPGLSETEWQIEYGTAGFTQGTGTFMGTLDNPATITGLAAGTFYDFYIRAICNPGDSSDWRGPYSFLTNPVPITVPFILDFESGTGTWLTANGSQTNQWYVGTATANNSAHSLYISNTGGTTNAYNLTSSSVVHFFNDITLPTGPYPFILTFDWKGEGESIYDYLTVYATDLTTMPAPGTMISTGQLLGTYNQQSSWQTEIIQIPASYAGTTMRLVFTWRNDGSLGTQPPAAIDNISVSVLTCPPVTGLTVYNITTNSATLTWTPGAAETQWQIEWGLAGFTQGQGTILSVTNDTFNLTGLANSTSYDYYVWAICSPGDTSIAAGPYTFRTECPPQSTLPLLENFDNNTTLPLCWSNNVINPGTGTLPQWTVEAGGTNPACTPVSGSNLARFNSYSCQDGAVSRLESALYDFSGTHQAKLRFFMYHDPGYSADHDSLAIQVFDGTIWTTIGGALRYDTTAGWTEYEYDLNAYLGANMKIGFLGVSAFGNDIYVDSVYIYCVPDSAYLSVTPGCINGSVTVYSTYNGTQTFYLRDATGNPLDEWTGNASSHEFTGLPSAGYRGQVGGLSCLSDLTPPIALDNTDPPLVYYVPPQSQDSVCLDAIPFALQGGYGNPAGGTGVYSGTGVSNNTFTPSVAGLGQHIITFTYTYNGCTSDTTAIITVYDCHVGISERDDIFVRIYPNPSNDFIFIEVSSLPEDIELNIYDLQGQLVYNEKLNANSKGMVKEMNLGSYPKGVYFIKLVNDRIMKISKIILN